MHAMSRASRRPNANLRVVVNPGREALLRKIKSERQAREQERTFLKAAVVVQKTYRYRYNSCQPPTSVAVGWRLTFRHDCIIPLSSTTCYWHRGHKARQELQQELITRWLREYGGKTVDVKYVPSAQDLAGLDLC